MNNIKKIVEQHPKSVAQLFSMYGIDKAVTEKNFAAAVVTYKRAFTNDLLNLIAQNTASGYEGADSMDGSDGDEWDVYEDYRGRRRRSRRRNRRRFKRLQESVPEGTFEQLEPQGESGGFKHFMKKNGEQVAISQQDFEHIPNASINIDELEARNKAFSEGEPVDEEDTDGFDGMEGKFIESARGRKKEKATYGAGGVKDFDVKASRRDTSKILDTIGKVGGVAADLAGKGIGLYQQVKGGQAGQGGGGGADGSGAPGEQSFFAKYKIVIIGGAVLVVIVIGALVMSRKK